MSAEVFPRHPIVNSPLGRNLPLCALSHRSHSQEAGSLASLRGLYYRIGPASTDPRAAVEYGLTPLHTHLAGFDPLPGLRGSSKTQCRERPPTWLLRRWHVALLRVSWCPRLQGQLRYCPTPYTPRPFSTATLGPSSAVPSVCLASREKGVSFITRTHFMIPLQFHQSHLSAGDSPSPILNGPPPHLQSPHLVTPSQIQPISPSKLSTIP